MHAFHVAYMSERERVYVFIIYENQMDRSAVDTFTQPIQCRSSGRPNIAKSNLQLATCDLLIRGLTIENKSIREKWRKTFQEPCYILKEKRRTYRNMEN